MDIITQAARDRQRVLEYFQNHKEQKGVTVTYVCHRYHTSRKTFYEWQGRWDGTVESLADRSRAPHKTRQGHTVEQLKMIKRLAKKHHWNDILLAYQEAVQRYGYPFCYQTFKKKVREMYAEKGMKKKKKRKNKPYQRAEYPGQKVQIDVKYVPSECVVNGSKYYVYVAVGAPLAVDECSRWTYRQMYEEHSTYSSTQFLEELVKAAPFQIRMVQTDNGSEFTKSMLTAAGSNSKTSFEEKLDEYGIIYHRIRPGTPRHNGKVERQNRLDQDRFYDYFKMYSLSDGKEQLAIYQKNSNSYWKLCLGMKSPNDIIEELLGVM